MPIPAIILWGAAAVIGAVGGAKAIDAHNNNSKAERIVERSKDNYKRASEALENDRKGTGERLAALGKLKAEVFSHQIKHLVSMHKKFHSRLKGYNESFTVEDLRKCEKMVAQSVTLSQAVSSGSSAAVSGGLTALGAYGAVGAFATASTGTAISALSGAAATNATLAWLGGGSLAAGGFGMAGGMVALGGIALAPILAIAGFWAAGRSEENLSNAKDYESQVDQACAQMERIRTELSGIRANCDELAGVIHRMAELFNRYKVYDMKDRESFEKMMLIGKKLKAILDLPVIRKDGSAIPNIRATYSGLLEF
ncbi:hypothetical protein [Succinimonas sp.]|uniref:hypothetical protein n=1 Tax=Succinimonas sp. TaxID=1936151 RepID=UPI00386F6259